MKAFRNGMRASSISGGRWVKSGRSNADGNCVELAALPGGVVAVRNSRYPDGPALVYTASSVAVFVDAAKDGALDFLTA